MCSQIFSIFVIRGTIMLIQTITYTGSSFQFCSVLLASPPDVRFLLFLKKTKRNGDWVRRDFRPVSKKLNYRIETTFEWSESKSCSTFDIRPHLIWALFNAPFLRFLFFGNPSLASSSSAGFQKQKQKPPLSLQEREESKPKLAIIQTYVHTYIHRNWRQTFYPPGWEVGVAGNRLPWGNPPLNEGALSGYTDVGSGLSLAANECVTCHQEEEGERGEN